ncbi:MAG TPA: hypothetical protein VG015_01415 [Candidatus Dormibacteraeota bacterium]|jgi:hypothetical protein|nr:hypothetical protein [Candidatus Dormibacteraeota bacterium]
MERLHPVVGWALTPVAATGALLWAILLPLVGQWFATGMAGGSLGWLLGLTLPFTAAATGGYFFAVWPVAVAPRHPPALGLILASVAVVYGLGTSLYVAVGAVSGRTAFSIGSAYPWWQWLILGLLTAAGAMYGAINTRRAPLAVRAGEA